MPSVSIILSEKEMSLLKRRANKNLFSPREQAEDIIRRSLVSYGSKQGSSINLKNVDDKLVGIFSRERRGRKKKRI